MKKLNKIIKDFNSIQFKCLRKSLVIPILLFISSYSKAQTDTAYLNVKDFGAIGNGIHDDAFSFQTLVDYIANGSAYAYRVIVPPGVYLIGSSIELPQTLINNPIILWEGFGSTLKTTGAISTFKRIPGNQTDAMTDISSYRAVFKGFVFEGNELEGQKAFDLGAIYSWAIEDCAFNYLDTSISLQFALQTTIERCRFTNNLNVAIKLNWGHWTDGNTANAATNVTLIKTCRVYNFSDPGRQAYAAIATYAADQTEIRDFISEGAHPRFHIVMDVDGSSNVNQNLIENVWFESGAAYASHCTYFRLKQAGSTTTVKNVQSIATDTLFDLSGTTGSSKFIFNGFPFYNLSATPFNAGGSGALSGSFLFCENVPQAFAAALYDPSSWVGGYPSMDFAANTLEYAGKGVAQRSSSNYYFEPAAFTTSAGSKHFQVNGGIEAYLDDTYSWGGNSSSAKRPKTIFIGTGGVYNDNSSRYYFGSPSVTPDLSISRDSISQIGILDNGSTYANIKAARGLFTTMSGYTNTIGFSSLGQFDFISKEHLTAANISGLSNLYTADGTLSNSRTVSFGSNTLNFNGSTGFGNNPAASAQVDIASTTKGILIPRMTTVQRDAIGSPAEGLQIYNNDTHTTDYYNGTDWAKMSFSDFITSSTSTLTFSSKLSDLIFTGSSATWTLPAVASAIGRRFYLKNRGSGTVTIQSASGGNDIYGNVAVSTYSLLAGSSVIIFDDGTYFNIE